VLHNVGFIVLPHIIYLKVICIDHLLTGLLLTHYGFHHRRPFFKRIPETQPLGLIAVFAGATAGTGLHTLKQLARHANAPRVDIIGRSRAKAAPLLDELKVLNPEGTYVFSEGEFSLVKDVELFSEEIKKAEERVDILCMSPGYLSFSGREGKRSRN
jgi:hypothetical protein